MLIRYRSTFMLIHKGLRHSTEDSYHRTYDNIKRNAQENLRTLGG